MFPSSVGEVSNLAVVKFPFNTKLYYKEDLISLRATSLEKIDESEVDQLNIAIALFNFL